EGRLMVDRHNRLTFPVVRHFRGRIVKTIGDSIMATFSAPEDALRAAVAMQQLLAARRAEDPEFDLHIRIGIHTGTAVVERHDVFGDVVNVAARVEGFANGDQVFLSGSTAKTLSRNVYALRKRDDFRAKGKRRAVPVWECDWSLCADQHSDVRLESLLPLAAGQKTAVAVYTVISVAGLYLLYHWYGRFLLSDWEWIALVALNPVRALRYYWWVLPVAAGGVALLTAGLAALRTLPLWVLRLVQGGAGFTLGLLLGAAIGHLPGIGDVGWLQHPLYQSQHLFVEARADHVDVREKPDLHSDPILQVNQGELMLLADVANSDGITWNRVLVAPGAWGWVPRVLPAARGHPEKRLTWADKFYFRRIDAVTLLLGLSGLLVGVRRFGLQPF
ncbi:MAG TPA: adenylate/guanylate cyclase domain-containing protein, partial [Gammaproteobacteria bacterium]|nr:adenylate/guanylate cyclase domain-containing protein [Gammaproteobacteria bacterium]